MMVKDEIDIIEFTIRHLIEEVDFVIVSDNGSTDGTFDLVVQLQREGLPLRALLDSEVGYWQSRKMTALAQLALEEGHAWVVPCDADEYWYAADGRTITAFLAGQAPDVQIVLAHLYHHIPSDLDPEDDKNPFRRIGWRKREHAGLPKVACRARPDLTIDAGNHSARTNGTASTSSGLIIRHYSWRTEGQFLRKIRNGVAAYAATDLPEGIGEHWRMWQNCDDEQVRAHFHTWFHSEDPYADDSLIFDPIVVTIVQP